MKTFPDERKLLPMIRRILCALCAVLLLIPALPAAAESAGDSFSYDFDLSFSLNAESFPKLLRSRAAGYAALAECLGLKGNIAWSTATGSMDLNATVYFRDKPSLAYPFRLYGSKSRLFFTSPLIRDEVIFFNMSALMEFAVKARNTLGIPLPYLALLFPYTTEYAFSGMRRDWDSAVGAVAESGEVTIEQFRTLSELWEEQFRSNHHLQRWIMALAEGSSSPDAVETELMNLPYYYEYATLRQPVSVTVEGGSVSWINASGAELFSREEAADGLSVALTLPPSENNYITTLTYDEDRGGEFLSFAFEATVCQDGYVVYPEGEDVPAPAGAQPDELPAEGVPESPEDGDPEEIADEEILDGDEEILDEETDDGEIYEEEIVEYDDYGDDEDWNVAALPDLLLYLSAEGQNLPKELPADSSFALLGTVRGAAYPNYSFHLKGQTGKDGSLTLSLCKPDDGETKPVEIFRCAGTLLPGAPKDIPDYQLRSLDDVHNVFSFNEQRLSAFTGKVLPLLVRSVFTFVEAAPTSACQSFLDDLTDSGVLDMLLD